VVPYADSREFAELAQVGEAHGWDGIFTWEAVFGVDAWVTLGAAAMVTERIRLGTLLTPVPRWRPWDLASRVGTVDRLSGGRAIMGAGLGALHDGWTAFEADEGRRVRAQKLDEGLAVFDGLMRGQPFSFEGTHYTARPTDFMLPPPPVQQPRPPVWVLAAVAATSAPSPSGWAAGTPRRHARARVWREASQATQASPVPAPDGSRDPSATTSTSSARVTAATPDGPVSEAFMARSDDSAS